MGPDVQVSNLWAVRDFWEWLFPGYSQNPKSATSAGAIIYYEGINNFRDFEFRKEFAEQSGDVAVGM